MKASKKAKVLAGILAAAMAVSAGTVSAFASVHTEGDKVQGSDTAWTQWTQDWNQVATDYTKVSMTPGADETQMNFAWYSKGDVSAANPVVKISTNKDMSGAKEFKGTAQDVKDVDAQNPKDEQDLTGGVAYASNHVTVTGLKASTTYYYTVMKGTEETEPESFKTGDFKSAKMLFVGDPQIGASGDSGTGTQNTGARNDAYTWDRTLDIALQQNPDVNYIISAGDQINRTGKPKEEEYAGYLNASALKSLPVATTIGNHDSLNTDYQLHFNNPNATQNGLTDAGGDYYYSYADGLFIVLNTNNYNGAEHEKTIQEAIAKYPDAKWRVVTLHQDIYGAGADHSGTDGLIQRTQLTPLFDKYDIDVVLQGHDHSYARSKMLESDENEHGTYKFSMKPDGSDYDWDHATNATTGEQYDLPDFTDPDSVPSTNYYPFEKDNHCYVMEDYPSMTAKDPSGTLYITSNSASGSKFYELISTQQDYLAYKNQNHLPNYSVIEMNDQQFKITTYEVESDGTTKQIEDPFTIVKTADKGMPAKDTATAVRCSVSGETSLGLGVSTEFTIKTANQDAATKVNVGNGAFATVDTVKAWDPDTQTATYRVYQYKPGNGATDVYSNGERLFTARVATRPFASDTTMPVTIAQGKTYNVRLTVDKDNAKYPLYDFTTGNSAVAGDTVLKTTKNADGSVTYDFRFTGKSAGSTSIYVKMQGEQYTLFTATVQ